MILPFSTSVGLALLCHKLVLLRSLFCNIIGIHMKPASNTQKRRLSLLLTAGTLLLICLSTPIPYLVMAFFFTGVVPGSGFVIPAWAMLAFWGACAVAVFLWMLHETRIVPPLTVAPKKVYYHRAASVSGDQKKRQSSRTVRRRYNPLG